MTVNEFYEVDPETYGCCRFYTTILCNTAQEYRQMTEEQFASKAYSAWCSGVARKPKYGKTENMPKSGGFFDHLALKKKEGFRL